jgi:hypothetical protein
MHEVKAFKLKNELKHIIKCIRFTTRAIQQPLPMHSMKVVNSQNLIISIDYYKILKSFNLQF